MSAFWMRLSIAGVLFGAGFICAWQWQSSRYAALQATRERGYQADLAAIGNAAAAQVRDALSRQQIQEQARDRIDQQVTLQKELLNAENQTLRRAVADGTRRLRIAGSCRAGSVHLPGTPGTARLDDAGAVELDSDAGQRVLDLRGAIIADQTALSALQRYVREVCLK